MNAAYFQTHIRPLLDRPACYLSASEALICARYWRAVAEDAYSLGNIGKAERDALAQEANDEADNYRDRYVEAYEEESERRAGRLHGIPGFGEIDLSQLSIRGE